MSQPSRNRGADCKLIDAGDVRKYFEVGKNRWQELRSIEIYCSGTIVGMWQWWVGRLSVFSLLQWGGWGKGSVPHSRSLGQDWVLQAPIKTKKLMGQSRKK